MCVYLDEWFGEEDFFFNRSQVEWTKQAELVNEQALKHVKQ